MDLAKLYQRHVCSIRIFMIFKTILLRDNLQNSDLLTNGERKIVHRTLRLVWMGTCPREV